MVGYRQTNQKTDTGKTLTRWPVFVDHFKQVASYADAWTELNNKVANSVRTGETQAEVMQRIFDVSQATQSSLNGTATLYARLER